jgi:hypothetical protein
MCREPVSGDETVFRRIPAVWYQEFPSPQAFRATEQDVTGLSVYRSAVRTAQSVGESGRSGKTFYVAEVPVWKLQELGLEVVADDSSPGHAEIPQIRLETRDDQRAKELAVIISESCILKIHGPFVVSS